MDGSRFDAWTRRRFGLATGGLTLALLGVIAGGGEDAGAKKRRKKKKCRKTGQGCTQGSRRKCCKNLLCEAPNSGATRCCKDIGQACGEADDCCTGFCFDDVCQPEICKQIGDSCNADDLCCSNNCEVGICAAPEV